MIIKKLKKNNLFKFFFFLNKFYKKRHIFFSSKKIFNWQYKNNKNYNFYYLNIKKKITAIQGYIPLDRFDKDLKNDTVFLSLWSSSTVTAGSKLFLKFLKKINYKLIAGLGGTEQSFLFQKLLKFKCGYMIHYFLTSNKSVKKLIYPNNFSNYKYLNHKVNFEELKSKKEILTIEKNLFKSQIPKKSPNYLLNRYLNHPVYNYSIYKVVKNLKTIAIFVFRICKYKKNSAVRIIDFVGQNKSFPHGRFLFHFLLNKFRSDYIDIYCYGVPETYLKKSRLENVEKYKKIKLIIPNYFEPFKKKNIVLRYAYKLLKKSKSKVRFFKGDSDLDRPNVV